MIECTVITSIICYKGEEMILKLILYKDWVNNSTKSYASMLTFDIFKPEETFMLPPILINEEANNRYI